MIFLITLNPIQNHSQGYNKGTEVSTKSKQTLDGIPFTNFLNNGEQSFSLKISMNLIIREVKRLRRVCEYPIFGEDFREVKLGNVNR